MKLLSRLFCGVLMCSLFFTAAMGVDLSATVKVNQTSDTAAQAKNIAVNGARKQILFNVLSQYCDKNELDNLLQAAKDEELMNLILSSSVSNEHISATTYSADITMNIDNDAAKKWLVNNNVQNWVPSVDSVEKFTVFIVASNGLSDWAELQRVARSENIDIETQSITGNQIIVKLPLNYRTKFTADVRALGWHYTDNNGVLQIWK